MSARVSNDELSRTLHRMSPNVFKLLATLTDRDIVCQQIVYRILAASGFVFEAVTILRMDHVDYEALLFNIGDDLDQVVS